MTVCGKEAVLLITMTPAGTATNVARRRAELKCSLPAGHDGAHKDEAQNETWEPSAAARQMLFRHEDEER